MTHATTGQLLALRVADGRFGIPASMVREVARLPRLTRVPHAPPAMLGLANIRGAALPVLSLAQLLGRTPGDERRIVVVDADVPVGLAVDAVAELLGADDASIEAVDAAGLVAATIVAGAERVRASAGADGEAIAESADSAISIVTFAIAGQAFALPLDAVEEVLRMPAEVAAVPHADPVVLGSIAVRGALLPLLSLAGLLALPGAEITPRSRVLVARIGEHRVGLVVDAMRAILRVAERDIDPVPLVLTRGDAEARIQAVCRIGGGKLVSVLAAGQLLREDITARLLQGSAVERVAVAVEAEASAQYLLFRVGEGAFGIPLSAVEEVAMLPADLARLPKSPDFVRGIMNLRGKAVPVIDQARRFGAAGNDGKQRVLVVRDGALRAGLLVDSASEVRRIPASGLRPAPDLGDGATRVFDQSAVTGEDVILIVSPHELLDRAGRDVLRAMTAP